MTWAALEELRPQKEASDPLEAGAEPDPWDLAGCCKGWESFGRSAVVVVVVVVVVHCSVLV